MQSVEGTSFWKASSRLQKLETSVLFSQLASPPRLHSFGGCEARRSVGRERCMCFRSNQEMIEREREDLCTERRSL